MLIRSEFIDGSSDEDTIQKGLESVMTWARANNARPVGFVVLMAAPDGSVRTAAALLQEFRTKGLTEQAAAEAFKAMIQTAPRRL